MFWSIHFELTHLVIIIGCGEYKPLRSYITDLRTSPSTPFPYPIYAHPSLSLHRALGFISSLGYSKAGEEKAYEANLGGIVKRTMTALKEGPVAHIGDVMNVGPKAQNGGEMILEAGKLFCSNWFSFITRLRSWSDRWHLPVLTPNGAHCGSHGAWCLGQRDRSDSCFRREGEWGHAV